MEKELKIDVDDTRNGIAEKQAWEVRCAEISLCRQQKFIPEISSASAILEIIVVFCGLS